MTKQKHVYKKELKRSVREMCILKVYGELFSYLTIDAEKQTGNRSK